MLIGSFLVGTIPLVFQMSQGNFLVASAFGVGLLVGTSLIVIIPEGIETLYNVPQTSLVFPHVHQSIKNSIDNVGVPLEQRVISIEGGIQDLSNKKQQANLPEGNETQRKSPESEPFVEQPESREKNVLGLSTSIPENEDDHSHSDDTHHYIGLALISGFALMFLIDQLDMPHQHPNTELNSDHTELHPLTNDIDLEEDQVHNTSEIFNQNVKTKIKSRSMTIGLVIHAAADGIALGASANQPSLEFLVFLAIMLHKAPSAFGLCTVLLREGYNHKQICLNVAIFSLSAPLTAMLTYLMLQGDAQLNSNSMQWWTAILLIFSGGTFLYVSMHVMQNVNNGNGSHPGRLSIRHLIPLLLGMFFPILLEFGHEHDH
ncbi:hypothetical protein G9A89_013509 [Geosiphon pyriformis]|nr:hypothetical protein G9A89_013509 [Geosiphon pyriformis]